MPTDSELLLSVHAEMRLLRQEEVGVRLEIAPETAFATAALLQLALRHPEVAATASAELAREVIDLIRQKLAPFPAMSEVLRRGQDPRFDT